MLVSHHDLPHKRDELESKADCIEVKHDNVERHPRLQIKQVFEAMRELSSPAPEPVKKPSIGFVTPDDLSNPTEASHGDHRSWLVQPINIPIYVYL